MDLSIAKRKSAKIVFQDWHFRQSLELQHQKDSMREEKRRLEAEKRNLELEKHLFEMKWRILEEELRKLADEKQQVKRQKEFYKFVTEHEERSVVNVDDVPRVSGELFFIGVASKQALKKRYKDLIRIYHPDNDAGDTETIQEINREYEKLQELYR